MNQKKRGSSANACIRLVGNFKNHMLKDINSKDNNANQYQIISIICGPKPRSKPDKMQLDED